MSMPALRPGGCEGEPGFRRLPARDLPSLSLEVEGVFGVLGFGALGFCG